MPALQGDALDWMVAGLGLAIVAIIVLGHWAKKRQEATGIIFPLVRAALGLLVVLPVAGWLISGASLSLEMPVMKGFNFSGGISLSPEFVALLTGLIRSEEHTSELQSLMRIWYAVFCLTK